MLTIQGERRFASESSDQQFHRVERRYGTFRRTVTLPTRTKANEIAASFEQGVLEVVVPKAEEAARARSRSAAASPPSRALPPP